MVNWDEAGKTWPQPHPHAARLPRGLLWGQQYRHSNPVTAAVTAHNYTLM